MSKYKTEFNIKQIEAVKDYLEKRFGCYTIAGYKLEINKTDRYTFQYQFKQTLGKSALGIFRHALKECLFVAKVWELDVQEDEVGHRHLIEIGLEYEHFGGGTNGCDLDIKFYVTSEGKIFEIYK